jgi:rhodanese-related sulfurtransferase
MPGPGPRARDTKVRTQTGFTHTDNRRVADLQDQTAQLERQLSDARMSLERELALLADGRQADRVQNGHARGHSLDDADYGHAADSMSALLHESGRSEDGAWSSGDPAYSPEDRTAVLLSHGRRSAARRGMTRAQKVAIGAVIAALALTAVLIVLFTGRASWPASVSTVESQAQKACRNPDVQSEPGQVNFACAEATRRILWVFALMTSGNDPDFSESKTGRVGLEPITPSQGGQVAWSLNFHHPYDPTNPIDSLAVAARAINNLIGGATVTAADGSPVVQPGLESQPTNCVRYTGSAELTGRKGYPPLCAKPVTSQAGQAALVADVYRKWVVGAPPRDVRAAAVLFENADNPGDPQVQAILKRLSQTRRSA